MMRPTESAMGFLFSCCGLIANDTGVRPANGETIPVHGVRPAVEKGLRVTRVASRALDVSSSTSTLVWASSCLATACAHCWQASTGSSWKSASASCTRGTVGKPSSRSRSCVLGMQPFLIDTDHPSNESMPKARLQA